MNLSSLTLLKVLLDSSAKKEELIPFFSEIDLDDFEKITTDAITFSAQDFLYEHLLGEVHYSWFLPTLKSYSSKEASLFLLSLPSAFGEKISPLLKLPLIDAKLAKTAKRYFRKLLLDSLLGEEKEILPKNYLPPSSLNVLASFTKNQLLRIIDLLALYDLAIEMKKIVATATLKKIYDALTKEEGKFLKSKLSLKEPFIFPSLGLEKWDGSKEMLRSLLRKRGLIRFAKALSIQHVHLIWYICHRLDIGRGIFLFRSATKKEEPKIAERVIGYIEEILSLIKLKKEESS